MSSSSTRAPNRPSSTQRRRRAEPRAGESRSGGSRAGRGRESDAAAARVEARRQARQAPASRPAGRGTVGSTKRTTSSKADPKKRATQRATQKKAATRKPVAKKATPKKTASRKPAAKQPAAKRPTARTAEPAARRARRTPAPERPARRHAPRRSEEHTDNRRDDRRAPQRPASRSTRPATERRLPTLRRSPLLVSVPDPAAAKNPAPRMLMLVLLVVVAASGLVWRLVDVQLINAAEFVEIGRQQRFRTVQLSGDRGDILDRNGNPLAISLPSTSFFTDPHFVEDAIAGAARLAPVLGDDVDNVRSKLGGDGRFSWLGRQVSDSKAAEIRALDIPGVFTTEEPTRFHPSGTPLARSVIGSTDIDGLGRSGMELILNETLEGKSGELQIEIGVNGNTIPGGPRSVAPAVAGADVLLTLDRSLQFEVERILRRQVESMGAQGGVVVVTRPGTGEVLAMANLARNDDGRLVSPSINMASTWSFEPGSVMKAVTFASVLDAGVASTSTRIDVPDHFELYDAKFTDTSTHDPEPWTIADIITVSSNVGTILWAEQLGGDRLDEYLRDFGFGTSPKLGFPGETAGLMIEDDWGGIATATTALGQGISVTPVQMIAAYNTIANDGVYKPLQLVREVARSDGTREVPARPQGRQVVSSQVASDVRLMLENAVAVGTGTNAQVPGYRVAGKTGTARKPLDGGGGYQDGAGNYRYVASFVGFLPADQPELSILVTIDQPTASIYAGHAAAPAFADIAHYAVRHFRIAPPSQVAALRPAATSVAANPTRLAERVSGEAATAPVAAQEAPTSSSLDADPIEGVADADEASLTDGSAEVVTPQPTEPTPDDGTEVINQAPFGDLAASDGGQ